MSRQKQPWLESGSAPKPAQARQKQPWLDDDAVVPDEPKADKPDKK